MTYEGARGETANQMRKVMHYPKDDGVRRTGFKETIGYINAPGRSYMLSTANALWAQNDFSFLDEYFRAVDKFYGGKVTNLDFAGETEKSRQTINTWVEDNTNKKIKDLIPQGILLPGTKLVLTNAVHFKANWVRQFDPENTINLTFWITPTKSKKAEMMVSQGEESKYKYVETGKYQALELPYDGDELSMIVILPKSKDITSVESELSKEMISEIRSGLAEQAIDVYIPKFKFETKSFLKDVLSVMGMPIAFSNAADFSGMTGLRDLYIDKVIHQAYIDVNEEGTEAAAATAVIMIKTSAEMPPSPVFMADHPFILLIQEKNSGNILFMGRISDPKSE